MKEISTGMNRTGVATSPIDSRELVEFVEQVPPSSEGSERDAAAVRIDAARQSGPVGSVPPPLTVKGAVQTALSLLKGRSPAPLIDKLGERLAFERTGTRLYEAAIAKLDATGSFAGGPTREELVAIHDEEFRHFAMVSRAMQQLGADPTAQTPGADVIGVASMGILQVAGDPRTTLAQTLEAVLVAELADNDGWRMLVALATAYGQDEIAAEFCLAEQREKRHLELVRSWLDAHAAVAAGEAAPAAEPRAAA